MFEKGARVRFSTLGAENDRMAFEALWAHDGEEATVLEVANEAVVSEGVAPGSVEYFVRFDDGVESVAFGDELSQVGTVESESEVYKWANPLEWLTEKAGEWDAELLMEEFLAMARSIGFDAIQELYESSMAEDEFFEPLESGAGSVV